MNIEIWTPWVYVWVDDRGHCPEDVVVIRETREEDAEEETHRCGRLENVDMEDLRPTIRYVANGPVPLRSISAL